MTLARDVAKQLERRQLRRRLLVLGGLGGLIVLAFLYLHCGAGWGFGGSGDGSGAGSASASAAATPDAGVRRCQVRIDAGGVTVDGVAATPAQAVQRCTHAGADVVITGDARQGDWDAVRSIFDGAAVPTYVKR